MASLVDSEAVLVEFEAFLVGDGRKSHGTDFLTRKLAELRAAHRIDESAEGRMLRHFSAHLQDVFLGLVPAPATSDPLTSGDRETPVAMDGSADPPSNPLREVPCPTTLPPRSPPSRPEPVSHRVAPPRTIQTTAVAAAATS